MGAATDLTQFTDEIVSCGYTGLLKLDRKDSIIRSVLIFQRNDFYFYIINFDAHSISSHFNTIVLLLFLEMQNLNLKYTFVQPCLSLNLVVWKIAYFPFIYESSAKFVPCSQ